ncbi:MAG: hypothetical protein K5765_03145 [Clostridia bacterium]|nr:hypothetical protein [Clostridia bacterium]
MKKNKKENKIITPAVDQQMSVNDTLPTRKSNENNIRGVVQNKYDEIRSGTKNTDSSVKSYKDMTDEEFVQNADILARPYYEAYMKTGAFRNVEIDTNASIDVTSKHDETIYPEIKKEQKANEAIKKEQKYCYKRSPVIFLVFILCILFVAVMLIGSFDFGTVSQNVSYLKIVEGGKFSSIETITGLIGRIFNKDMGSVYSTFFENEETMSAYQKIPMFVLPVATVLLFICTLLLIIKCIIAMASKKGIYGETRKYKFVGLIVVMFALSILVFFSNLLLANFSGSQIYEFLKGDCIDTYVIGYAPLIMVCLTVVMFIIQFFSYKVEKVNPQKYLD